jgi:hypothetical protein
VLGLSLTKILFTILVVVVVWKGFALVGRLARERQAQLRRQASQPSRSGQAARPRTIELVECRRCGAYFDPREGCGCGHRGG